jgi:hypothetical protein
MNDLNAFGIHGFGDNTKVGDALARWYRPSESDVVAQVGANTLAAIDDVAGVSWTSAARFPRTGRCTAPTTSRGTWPMWPR